MCLLREVQERYLSCMIEPPAPALVRARAPDLSLDHDRRPVDLKEPYG